MADLPSDAVIPGSNSDTELHRFLFLDVTWFFQKHKKGAKVNLSNLIQDKDHSSSYDLAQATAG